MIVLEIGIIFGWPGGEWFTLFPLGKMRFTIQIVLYSIKNSRTDYNRIQRYHCINPPQKKQMSKML